MSRLAQLTEEKRKKNIWDEESVTVLLLGSFEMVPSSFDDVRGEEKQRKQGTFKCKLL